ncbi:hypothetical protein GGR21_000552 [Dysgonomonas hofstadii]|uniref:Uncharacterized protein n=1 Tax=Dysgonomonas hofstadii TaxID=637886 RepID=A0A840CNV6_9BACT|nr:hypothetical protein [Dysgonomonas hofstadii]MBB4034665.1 hypothetical protein [Dysgonomonas hofstadii]
MFVINNRSFFCATRNRRLLVFLLAKSPKGTKNALVAHPSCDPLQAHGLNGKIVLRTLSISRPAEQMVGL